MANKKDLSNIKFGPLLVLKLSHYEKYGKYKKQKPYWIAQCDCGKEHVVDNVFLYRARKDSKNCLDTKKKSCKPIKRRLEPGVSSLNSLLRGYKFGAKSRGLAWELSIEQFKILTKGNCVYCGVEPRQSVRDKYAPEEYIYNGIDRVDNKQGYTESNSVSCCGICNTAKHALSLEQYEEWVTRLIKFREINGKKARAI